ncbi:MAG TPA: DUF6152 family protein [Vicinamibacterales bacterium]
MRPTVLLIALALVTLGSGQRLGAHHSVPVNFDTSKEITVDGVITEVVWRNPHSRFRIDAKGTDGSTVEWLVEMGASNTMKRAGFPMERFMVGDQLTITGWPGRRDRTIFLRETVLKDGTHLDPEMRRAAQVQP